MFLHRLLPFYLIAFGGSAPVPRGTFPSPEKYPKGRIREGPFRWGPSLMNPSPATTQRGGASPPLESPACLLLVLLSFGFSRGCDTPEFINVPVYFFGAGLISCFYILNVSPQNLSDVSRFASSGSPRQFFEFFIDLFGQNHTDGNLLSAHAITSELYFTAVRRESVIGNIAYAQGNCSAKTKQRKNSRSGERYRGGIQRGQCPLCVVAGGGS